MKLCTLILSITVATAAALPLAATPSSNDIEFSRDATASVLPPPEEKRCGGPAQAGHRCLDMNGQINGHKKNGHREAENEEIDVQEVEVEEREEKHGPLTRSILDKIKAGFKKAGQKLDCAFTKHECYKA